MNHFFASGLLNYTIFYMLGVFVYLKNRKNIVNQTFSLFVFSVAVYSFGFSQQAIALTPESSLFWIRFILMGTIFIPIFFLQFTYAVLERKIDRRILAGLYIAGIAFEIANFLTEWLAADPIPKYTFRYLFQASFLYYFLFLFFAVCVIYALYKLHQAYYRVKGAKRTQLKYLFWASLIGFCGGSFGFLLGYNCVSIYPLIFIANYGVSIYGIITAYAIVAHRLMDIEVIIKRTLVYSIIISIITVLYFLSIFCIERIFSQIAGYSSIPLTICFIAFFSIIFIPFKNYVQRVIDKYFFHGTIEQINDENIKLRGEIEKTEKLKAVATLAAGMAHEIKNPLTGIKTFTEYLPQKYNDPKFMEKFQKIVGGEIDRINSIVKQLLEFARPRELKLEMTDINKLLDDTVDFLNSRLLKKNIRTEKYYAILPDIQVDPVQMKQVFLNIFNNAIDSIENKGMITIETSQEENGKISIRVKDTGKGIDKDDLEHIFDPFFSRKEGGTGLGLNVVHGIVTKHGGEIKAENVLGNGALFEIVLSV